MPTLQKYTTFFLVSMQWVSPDDTYLNELVGSDNGKFYFSTFRSEIHLPNGRKWIVIPAVKEFSSFTDAGVSVNESGMAESIGGEKSLGVTFFDPYGFFWRKFTAFPPFSYENQPDSIYGNSESIGLLASVYLCKTIGDPSVLTEENTEFFFLFQAQLTGQPEYNFEDKTLSITLGSRTYNTERGYIPKIEHVDPTMPGYNFLAAFLNEQLWPDIYGTAQHYSAVPLLKNPYFSTTINKTIDYTVGTMRIWIEAADGANDVFFDLYQRRNHTDAMIFDTPYVYLFTGSSSDQYGGSFAYKATGIMGMDFHLDRRGRVSRYLYLDIDPNTITHYWYKNIPVTRLNDPSMYSDFPNTYVHVAERVKIKLGSNTGYGEYANGGTVVEVPWLQHMWVRLEMADNSVGNTRFITAKVVKQEGAVCTLDWVSNATPARILWAGRAAGPPTVFQQGTKIVPYDGIYGPDALIEDFWRLANTYIIDTKIIDQGTDIKVIDVSIANGQNGYTSLPPSAFQQMGATYFNDLRTNALPNYIGSCGHLLIPVDEGYVREPFLWTVNAPNSRPHEYCRFLSLKGREGILRFLCEEEFHKVQNSDFTYQLYVTAETYTRPDYAKPELQALMLECESKKLVWGYDYSAVFTGGEAVEKPRWDLGDFYPGQMSDVEAMGIIATICGLKYQATNSRNLHFECYPVNFILKEKKTALNLINEISWQKGKVLRQRSIKTEFIQEPDFIVETVDLMNLVSMQCPEIKTIWGQTERPAGMNGAIDDIASVGQNGSRYNFINENLGKDPLTPVHNFDIHDILDEEIQFSVSPEANLVTEMDSKVFTNRGDEVVDVVRTVSTMRLFGLRKLQAPVDYYAYAGRDTVYFLDFWLRKMSKPRLRMVFRAVMNSTTINLNIFDVVQIAPGQLTFSDETLGIPPMFRTYLNQPESFVFSGSDLPGEIIQDVTTWPICGRILNKRINPSSASVEFLVEIENIIGYAHLEGGDLVGKQNLIGGAFDIDGGSYIMSPYMQRGLPGPYDLLEGSLKIGDVLSEYDLETWLG